MVIIAVVLTFMLPSFDCQRTNLYFSFSSGDEKRDLTKDSYNYYLSQLRIRIEMSFGLLCSKFRILQRPIQVSLKGAGKLFLCCARLHNFVINQRIERSANYDAMSDPSSLSVDYEEAINAFLPSDVTVASIPGNSIMRDVLLQRIKDLALVRPQHNLERNRN